MYALDKYLIPLPRGRTAINTKKRDKKKKRIGAEDTPSTPTKVIDTQMAERRKNRRQIKESKERNRERDPNPTPLEHIDHRVGLF